MNLRNLAWAAAAVWLLTSLYLVPTDQQAVVTRFGAVIEPRVLPGIHIALPWPIDRATKLKVRQQQRLGASQGRQRKRAEHRARSCSATQHAALRH